jgi:hypothetical protein
MTFWGVKWPSVSMALKAGVEAFPAAIYETLTNTFTSATIEFVKKGKQHDAEQKQTLDGF